MSAKLGQKKLHLEGQRFGRLVAISRAPNEYPTVTQWNCICDCGNTTVVRSQRLRSGDTRSCGCLCAELVGNRSRTHGASRTPTFNSWSMMMNRCYNKNFPKFQSYGKAGVSVCEYIRASPHNLTTLIGLRPESTSIDRINNDGNYSCGQCAECLTKSWPINVRWATAIQQGRNKSSNRKIEINGVTKCVTEWCEISGRAKGTITKRFDKGIRGDSLLASGKVFKPK